MARALIVGCGCRGRLLGKRLLSEGWEVRGTSRRDEGLAAIEAAGIEPAFADPADPGSMLEVAGDVTVVAWILGSAEGTPEELSALHGPRLDRVLKKLVETPVRGFVYESVGSVDPILLARGRETVEAVAETWQIPVSYLLVDPCDSATWEKRVLHLSAVAWRGVAGFAEGWGRLPTLVRRPAGVVPARRCVPGLPGLAALAR